MWAVPNGLVERRPDLALDGEQHAREHEHEEQDLYAQALPVFELRLGGEGEERR